jgi:hypothetical protein
VPISKFQSDVLQLLAAQRSPDSYITGGIAINRQGPRFSDDIDIFHDSIARQESAVAADEAALAAAGYAIAWPPNQRTGKREATVAKSGEQMQLEWVTDSAFRFFPTQPDALFGYVLHPADLATNKAAAAADRRVPRDIVDLVTIHESILPLGAVVAAAVGKFIGTTPEEMLAEITRRSRFTAEEFQALATDHPIDVRDLHRRIRAMIEDAEAFIAKLPSDAVGVIFMDGERPVQPDVDVLDRYQRNSGAPRGLWPSSPDITHAMLERYGQPNR